MKKTFFAVIMVLLAGFGFSSSLWADEVGVTDKEIVIGSIMDLSGPIVSLGVPIKNSMNMKVKEVNDAGGIHGRKLKLVIGDDGYDPKKAIMVANKLISRDKVLCLVGNLGTPTTMAIVPILKRKNVPLLFPNAYREELYNPPQRSIFVHNPSYIDQARTIATYFARDKGKKRFGLLYQDDDLGAEMKKGLIDRLGKYNLKLLAAEPHKRGATDFSSQIAKLKKADLDMLVLATPVRETVGSIKEVRKLEWDVTISACGAAVTIYVPILAKKSGFSTDGVYTISNHCDLTTSDLPYLVEWRKRYKEMFGIPASMTCSAGYEPVHLFAIAAERAGRNLTRDTLISALETFKDVPAPMCGPKYSFGPNQRVGSRSYFMAQYQGMKIVQVTDFIK